MLACILQPTRNQESAIIYFYAYNLVGVLIGIVFATYVTYTLYVGVPPELRKKLFNFLMLIGLGVTGYTVLFGTRLAFVIYLCRHWDKTFFGADAVQLQDTLLYQLVRSSTFGVHAAGTIFSVGSYVAGYLTKFTPTAVVVRTAPRNSSSGDSTNLMSTHPSPRISVSVIDPQRIAPWLVHRSTIGEPGEHEQDANDLPDEPPVEQQWMNLAEPLSPQLLAYGRPVGAESVMASTVSPGGVPRLSDEEDV